MGGNGVIRPGGYYKNIERLEKIAKEEIKKSRDRKPRKRVFLSFISEDLDLVNLFRGQAKNENSELDFIDFSLRVPIDSKNAEYIKRGIRERIKNSSISIILIGKNTHKSKWVNWEIEESLKLQKPVLAVCLENPLSLKIPDAINKHKIKILTWDHKEINLAIQKLT